MSNFDGCQLPCVPKLSIGPAEEFEKSPIKRVKRLLAVPWNRYAKKWLKQTYHLFARWLGTATPQTRSKAFNPVTPFQAGDLVRVRSREEIQATLDPFKELKGCAFLPDMYRYAGTQQRVLKSMQNFMDERDYKLKKVRGVILLENIVCNGAPAFGPCDRCCFLFWREEWLEKITT
jgi:hypothetical protein